MKYNNKLYNFRFWLKKIFRRKRKISLGDILFLIVPTVDSYDFVEVEVIKEKRKYVIARCLRARCRIESLPIEQQIYISDKYYTRVKAVL